MVGPAGPVPPMQPGVPLGPGSDGVIEKTGFGEGHRELNSTAGTEHPVTNGGVKLQSIM